MPPKRRFYESDDFEVVDPPKSKKTQADHPLSDDRESIRVNLNWAYYEAQYKDFNDRLEAIHLEFEKILEDLDSNQNRIPRQKTIVEFGDRIDKAKSCLALVKQQEKNLWFFLNLDPLRIPGALFNLELIKNLADIREKLFEIFSHQSIAPLQKKNNKLISKDIASLMKKCEKKLKALTHLQKKQVPETSDHLPLPTQRGSLRKRGDEVSLEEMDD